MSVVCYSFPKQPHKEDVYMIRKSSGLSFIVPGIVIVAIMTQVPFILTVIFSVLRWNLARPDLPRIFVGLNNYLHFLRIESF